MAKRGQGSFAKREKEVKRRQKALEKMERRQNKKKETVDLGKEETAEPLEEQE